MSTVLGGGTPAPAAPAAPPASTETPAVNYAELVDSLKAPEDVPAALAFGDDEKSTLKAIAEEGKLTAEQLKVVHDKLLADRVADRKALERRVAEWQSQLQADPELSGENGAKWATTAANIERVFALGEFAEVQQFFNATGLGNHPMFVKLFNTIGAKLAPDSTAGGSSASTPASDRPEDVLYS